MPAPYSGRCRTGAPRSGSRLPAPPWAALARSPAQLREFDAVSPQPQHRGGLGLPDVVPGFEVRHVGRHFQRQPEVAERLDIGAVGNAVAEDGVIGRPALRFAAGVLRPRLMVERGPRWAASSIMEERSVQHSAGLDVSIKETSICIVDERGAIVRELKVESHPEDLLRVLCNESYSFKRIGLEAGPLSQWLYSALAEAGLPVVCVEVRHMKAILKAQGNKNDRNDARGIAQMMRVGIFRAVHVKTLQSQKLRVLLTNRKLLLCKAIDIENDIRGVLRNFGLKVGVARGSRFEARIRELVEEHADLASYIEPLLTARRVLREQFNVLHRQLLAVVRADEVCCRLMR